jgi:hypothetical protein
MSILSKIQDFFKDKKELEADKLPQKIYNSLVYTFYYNSPGWENMRKFFENVMTDPKRSDNDQANAASIIATMEEIEQKLPDVPKKGDMSNLLENKNILRAIIREEIKKVLKY